MKNAFVLPRVRQEHGVALLITLAVLVLVTIVAVTYATTARIESVSARSSFEKQRADALATVAVDEVVAKLRDNIPTNSQWAVGPGRLYNVATGTMTPLFSGSATGSPTGSVALNPPPLSGTGYPILSPNTDFPSPNPMQVAWINVLKDGTLDTGFGANRASPTNPAVGRYAYWVDTETSKVNLNSAGRAQTDYNYDMNNGANYANFDSQNLTGSPSRVDLSKLDGGITPAQSKATFDFTNSSYFLGDTLGTANKLDPPVRTAGQGGNRFDEIGEWATMPGAIPAITRQQVDLNQFYLTTRSRSPELNPWGLNKLWWQNGPAQRDIAKNQPGNVLDAPGAPAHPPGYTQSGYNWVFKPGFATFPAVGSHYADFRYYVYPSFVARDFTTVPGNLQNTLPLRSYAQNMQWIALPVMTGAPRVIYQNFIKNMTAQLQRTDWPGMPNVSFQDKYGQRECENLSLNMLYLFENAIYGGGAASPMYFRPNGLKDGARDDGLAYGGAFYYTDPTGVVPPRKIGGVGPWPYLNEVAVSFTPTHAGFNPDPTKSPNTLGSKDAVNPGFCRPIVNTATEPNATSLYMNVAMKPQLEFSYPITYPQPLWAGGRSIMGVNDIEVTASGIYQGSPVTYTGVDYAWGYRDDNPLGLTRGFACGALPGKTMPSATPYYTATNHTYYIGPFDIGTTPTITTRFRAYYGRQTKSTGYTVSQIAPTPPYGDGLADPVYAAWPGPSLNPETKFEFTTVVDLASPILTTSWVSNEVLDPRCYRYFSPNPSAATPSDWHRSTDPSGNTLGRVNSGYVSQMLDPVTDQTGDDSKFTWPDMGFTATGNYGPFPETNSVDARYNQFAGNIQGFPGIGWLSVLPLNTESCRTTADGRPIPWRTLNLGPASRADQLPDWLLLNAFALAYEQTFLSQTDGKINVNARVEPFGFDRLKPLQALLNPSSANLTTSGTTIAADLASATGAQSGPCGSLPAGMYVYPGQICQVPSLQGSGTNQYQKEALMRDIAGIVTTQSSDFKVHVIAQALNAKGVPTAEQRVEAVVSRTVDVGPDHVPATADDMAGPDGLVGTSDDLKFKANDGSTISLLKYDGTDLPLEELVGRPPFHFQITSYRALTQ